MSLVLKSYVATQNPEYEKRELEATKLRIVSLINHLGHSRVKFIPQDHDNPKWIEYRDQTRGGRTTMKLISFQEMSDLVKGLNINTLAELVDNTVRHELKPGTALSELDKWSNDLNEMLPKVKMLKESLSIDRGNQSC